MKKGRFIVFEGLDGTGKTSKLETARQTAQDLGYTVFLTEEPTGAPAGRLLREVLGGRAKVSDAALSALFLADRIDHCTDSENGIQKHLADGEVVISSRYYYSTFAYQGQACDQKWVMACQLDCPYILRPDLCIFLDAPPEVCVARIMRDRPADKVEIFENTATLAKVRAAFNRAFDLLGDKENIVRIDTDREASAADADVRRVVRELLRDGGE